MMEINSKMKEMRKLITLCFVSFVMVVAGNTHTAHAQTAAASACDPQYYQSLEAKAWLEAQREITQNQNLITKPDSVLAYTCFDLLAAQFAKEAKNMLSETQEFVGAPMLEGSLASQMGSVANGQLYMSNFNHKYRGGRHADGPYEWTNIREIVESGDSYTCNIMASVWEEAKCADFIEKDHDGFFTFAKYAADDDKRKLPLACASTPGWSKPNWNSKIESAGMTSDNTKTPWTEDPAQTFFDKLDPTNCAASDPVETGIKIKLSTGSAPGDNEFVCIQPGCYYDGSACVSL